MPILSDDFGSQHDLMAVRCERESAVLAVRPSMPRGPRVMTIGSFARRALVCRESQRRQCPEHAVGKRAQVQMMTWRTTQRGRRSQPNRGSRPADRARRFSPQRRSRPAGWVASCRTSRKIHPGFSGPMRVPNRIASHRRVNGVIVNQPGLGPPSSAPTTRRCSPGKQCAVW